ncbi:hypothetical protein [Flagellimonas sp. SN16]|uniref:hypothetical protein n=1 Tax=Flagellimonas sp. SN16 TaxID=3415142 RepID=UPI003C5A1E56
MIVKAEKYQGNYHRFEVEPTENKKAWLFTCSDIHFDNPKCDRKLFFKHMDLAVKRGAMIAITGDLFCLMQGKYDPRGSKSNVRPEHNKDNYLDMVINDTAEKFIPYAKNIILISRGNHETSVSKRMETDVMERFVERLNLLAGSKIQVGGYTGYYTLSFQYSTSGHRHSVDVGYSHGNWGGVITKGTLSVVRYASYMPDCDLMFSGHTHDGWIVTHPRLRKNTHKKTVDVVNQWHIKTGTYKEEFGSGSGWAVERIAMPKYLGGCFTEFNVTKNGVEFTPTLTPN